MDDFDDLDDPDSLLLLVDDREKDSFSDRFNRAICTALVPIFAFIVSNIFLQVMEGLTALFLKYSTRITYNQVDLLPRNLRYWNVPRITVVHVTGPILCVLIGLFILNYLKSEKRPANLARLYAFWFMVCLLNLVLAHLIFSPLGTYTNGLPGFYITFAVVGSWMHLNPGFMAIFSTAAVIASLLLGRSLRLELFKFNSSRKMLKSHAGQTKTIFQLFVLPVFIASGPLLSLCSDQSVFPMLIILANLIVISIGMFTANFSSRAVTMRKKKDILNHRPFVELGLAAVAWLATYLFLR